MQQIYKFQMSVLGIRLQDGGQCDRCGRRRAVVWVDELQEYRCSSCLCGMTDRRGRPKGSKDRMSKEDRDWVKANFPEHYQEVYAKDEQPPVGSTEPTWQELAARAGKMGPVEEETPDPPVPK